MGEGDTLLNAIVGAVVTVVFSFTAVSPVLGGAVAGYLQREDRSSGAKVGALSGLLAFLPSLGILVLVFGALGVLLTGSMFALAPVPGAPELLIVLLLFLPLALLWNVGLSALGGYLGVYLREETDL